MAISTMSALGSLRRLNFSCHLVSYAVGVVSRRRFRVYLLVICHHVCLAHSQTHHNSRTTTVHGLFRTLHIRVMLYYVALHVLRVLLKVSRASGACSLPGS